MINDVQAPRKAGGGHHGGPENHRWRRRRQCHACKQVLFQEPPLDRLPRPKNAGCRGRPRQPIRNVLLDRAPRHRIRPLLAEPASSSLISSLWVAGSSQPNSERGSHDGSRRKPGKERRKTPPGNNSAIGRNNCAGREPSWLPGRRFLFEERGDAVRCLPAVPGLDKDIDGAFDKGLVDDRTQAPHQRLCSCKRAGSSR